MKPDNRRKSQHKRVPHIVLNQLQAWARGVLPDETLLTLQAVGMLTSRSRSSLNRDINSGRLESTKRGAGVYVTAGEARRFMAEAAK